jgi:uncharacterized protein (DUF433 family)
MVYLVLELLEAGVSPATIRKRYYPQLSLADIKAALHFAAELIKNQECIPYAEAV